MQLVAHRFYHAFVLFYEWNNRLSIIFWDIFCLILQRFLYDCLLRFRLRFRLISFILRHSFLLSNPPWLLIEPIRKNRFDRLRHKRYIAALLFLLLDDPIKDAIIVNSRIMIQQRFLRWKYILNFDLTSVTTLLWLTALKHRKVENWRIVVRFDHDRNVTDRW